MQKNLDQLGLRKFKINTFKSIFKLIIFKSLIFKSIFKKVGSVCMQTPSGYKVKGVSFAQVFSCFVVVFFYNLPTNKFEHQSIFLVLLTNPMSCENSIKRVFDFRNPAQWPAWYNIFQKIFTIVWPTKSMQSQLFSKRLFGVIVWTDNKNSVRTSALKFFVLPGGFLGTYIKVDYF